MLSNDLIDFMRKKADEMKYKMFAANMFDFEKIKKAKELKEENKED